MDNLNHEIAYEAIKKGCQNIRFMESLIKSPAGDYYLLMERAPKYIHLNDEKQA